MASGKRLSRDAWRGGRVVEGARLLSGYTVEKPYRGFESHPLRQQIPAFQRFAIVLVADPPMTVAGGAYLLGLE
jgi:hypothetical protein